MFIPIILGTAREGRQSEKAAKFMLGEVQAAGHTAEIIDVRDYPLTATDDTGSSEIAKKYIDIITRADALIIVSPEYNHSFPGELKLVLDMAYKQYDMKPVGICGVSSGLNGGVRAVEQLRLVVIELKMMPIRGAVYFRSVKDLFDEKGEIKNKSYQEFTGNFLKDLVRHVKP